MHWLNLFQRPTFAAVLAISLIIGVGFGTSPAVVAQGDAGNLYNTAVDVRMGERYFQRQCSRCHGQDAKGSDETGAPDLTGSLRRASTDAGIYQILRNGISGTAMLPVPNDTPDPTVWQTVSYINSLRTDPANIDLPGSASQGLALFNGKGDCASCHMIDGEGGRLGPDLSFVGEDLDPDELRTALTNPSEDVAPRWWRLRVTGSDGVLREGFRMNEDSFSLRIMDSDENLWSFDKKQIQSYDRIEESTMTSYAQTLSGSELDDLVAYLFSLRREVSTQ